MAYSHIITMARAYIWILDNVVFVSEPELTFVITKSQSLFVWGILLVQANLGSQDYSIDSMAKYLLLFYWTRRLAACIE